MLHKTLLTIALVTTLTIGSNVPSVATEKDDVFERGCGDDDGNDRCAKDTQKKMRTSYGIEDARKLMETGTTVRRAMLVDGYGNDVIAISFLRRPGTTPILEVRVPCHGESDCPAPLVATISQEVWERALSQSRDFDQKLVREIPKKDTDKKDEEHIILCLHGWFAVVEAADAPKTNQNMARGQLRADAEGSCAEGLAFPYAFELAKLAHQNLPECSTLKIEWFRNSAMLLSSCAYLKGDRHAAGEAYAIVNQLPRCANDDEGCIEEAFAWTEQKLASKFREAWGDGTLYLGTPEGIDEDHAILRGTLFFDVGKDGDEKKEAADVTFDLSRENGEFEIIAFKIGERKKVPELD
jgi:hypothetical protein